jgi:hypothetical protein
VPFEGYELALLWHHTGLVTESPIVLPRGSASVVIAAQHEIGEVSSRSVLIEGSTSTSGLLREIAADEGPFGNLCGHNVNGTARLGLNELRGVRDADDPSRFDWTVAMAAFGPSTTVTRSVADVTPFLPGCWWYDIDVDGEPDLLNQYARYDPESLAVRVLYDRPDWEQSAATWYETGHGGIDVVADVNGTCRAEMPIELGVMDTVSGELLVRWRDAEGNDELIHTFNGGAVRQGDTVLWWGTESSSSGIAFPRHVVLAEANGLIRWRREEAYLSVPAIGDVDGDGAPELVAVGASGLTAWRLDGSIALRVEGDLLWTGTSPTLADLDGDNTYEILHYASDGLTIYDGRTGDRLANWPNGGNIGSYSNIAVADVNGDGSMDILGIDWSERADGEGGSSGIFVLSAAKGRFAKGRRVWNQVAYDVTSVAHDGSIIKWPIPSFDATNTFRAQPAFDGHYADLQPVLLGSCADDWVCSGGDGAMRLSVAATNTGSDDAPAGAELRLYTRKTPDCYQLVATHVIDEAIPSLTSSEPVVLVVPVEDWGNERVLEVWHDTIHDCDIINNRVPLDVDVCAE